MTMAAALEAQGDQALAAMPAALRACRTTSVALRPFDMVGLPALRALLQPELAAAGGAGAPVGSADEVPRPCTRSPTSWRRQERGLVMVMGKGGVGKTTIAAALAVALAGRGKTVHLTTTDPAAHLAATLAGRCRPAGRAASTRWPRHSATSTRSWPARGRDLDEAGRGAAAEDLRSPCTEEVAVFHAFSRIVAEARSAFVVLDTAPTGHTLLLMDATGAYHRQMTREFEATSRRTGR